jgi:hypothetical protein
MVMEKTTKEVKVLGMVNTNGRMGEETEGAGGDGVAAEHGAGSDRAFGLESRVTSKKWVRYGVECCLQNDRP